MTDAEKALWTALREQLPQGRWRHQTPFGPYTVDFCSHRCRLIVELDGGQHATRVAYDANRTRFLEAEGYKVLRLWNTDVLPDADGVLTLIAAALREAGR